MTYPLRNLVPWGRNFDEYTKMFGLTDTELTGRIAGFGDGPASFNAECCQQGGHVTSFDPIYRHPLDKVQVCLCEAKRRMLGEAEKNPFHDIKTATITIDEIEKHHQNATRIFFDDFEEGKKQGRYIGHELPYRIPFQDGTFDLGLSSHFLMLYPKLGINFHFQAMEEMLRTCHEIRVFPIMNQSGKHTGLTDKVIGHFCDDYKVRLLEAACHFMNGGNQMLVISKRDETGTSMPN